MTNEAKLLNTNTDEKSTAVSHQTGFSIPPSIILTKITKPLVQNIDCSNCDVKFSAKSSYWRHVSEKSSNPLKCNDCSFKSCTYFGLKSHQYMIKHNDEPNKKIRLRFGITLPEINGEIKDNCIGQNSKNYDDDEITIIEETIPNNEKNLSKTKNL